MSGDSRPELVIAVDFGMACTGVAYANIATGEETVRWLQKWPGRSNAVENKVPTVLVYPKDSSIPSSWGYLSEKPAEQMSEEKECKEWFKTFLDDDRLRLAQRAAQGFSVCPSSMEEVERLYRDYFRFLYSTIQQKLQGELANRWEHANIEFIFSVPTTWKLVPTVERFRRTIERAGFGAHPNHKAIIGLTEAEAAAVHTARVFPKLFKDLCVLRVTDTGGVGALSLEQMDIVQGATIGSVQLDTAFETTARSRLIKANQILPMGIEDKELDDMAWEMAKSKEYQNAKCEYGSSDDDTEFFTVAIPRLPRGYVNESEGINFGEMRFRRDEIRSYFDVQVIKLFDLIDKQLGRLATKFPLEQVSHLVLSGGLGNSAYVQTCLRVRYTNPTSPVPNARRLQIRVAPEPQLVVCKGIVADRMQKLRSGRSMLGWRVSRSSYGTLCKLLYDENDPRHQGVTTMVDSLDGKTYVMKSINWFIRQGEPVSTDYPIVKSFIRKSPPATKLDPDPHRSFLTGIVTCDLERDFLPLVMDSSCRTLCEISSDLSSLPLNSFKLKNRHWWNMGKEKYHRIEYVIKVNIGPADISFELWYNGQKISQENSISVEWKESAPPREVPPPNIFGVLTGNQCVPSVGGEGKRIGTPVQGSEGGNYSWI
ncbi:hypothetical protein HYALB_00008864 [Hymenoscyphus albidus]|uniref:Actin-like ATPase domain-containing protein n=1 Tax=Hymenoscyphus albidus TaxID=595503 RepID=A0A9N9LNG4_9HELO|nr:hypothetical protein HYALB_00008864 [Hymenoscyphus albidus]